MKLVKNPYTVSRVPGTSDTWYCHHKGYPYIPVFGSIGDKKKAQKVCKLYNKTCVEFER
jgi:hypothetical protein